MTTPPEEPGLLELQQDMKQVTEALGEGLAVPAEYLSGEGSYASAHLCVQLWDKALTRSTLLAADLLRSAKGTQNVHRWMDAVEFPENYLNLQDAGRAGAKDLAEYCREVAWYCHDLRNTEGGVIVHAHNQADATLIAVHWYVAMDIEVAERSPEWDGREWTEAAAFAEGWWISCHECDCRCTEFECGCSDESGLDPVVVDGHVYCGRCAPDVSSSA